MNTDQWYALRGAGTRFRQDPDKHTAHLVGTVNAARSRGWTWDAIYSATAVPRTRLRGLVTVAGLRRPETA